MSDERTASTLAEHAATQAGTASDAATLVPATGRAGAIVLPAPGYELREPIGRGGMGEVIAAHDQRIGREVALKRLSTDNPDEQQIARFLREARIQARLEHPAIVPVHELGVDAAGRPYFTMKRLAGKTLGERQAEGLPLQRLLRAFVDVCLAVELAHARGVVHRDLKPSNIMLGDFGEVYVIDWGIARVLGEDRDEPAPAWDAGLDGGGTQTGALLGTPGYMAPEHIMGQPATPASDVYALGSILFELLAGELLHKRGEPGIGSTLSDPQQSAAKRRPDRDIPPELDALCFAALAEDPGKRPSARELAEGVQAFLEGDRDVERRRAIAAEEVAEARALFEAGGPDARAVAMRRAGRALALDPQSEEAAGLVSRLLLEPPAQLPPDLARGLEEHERQMSRDRSRKATWVYLSVLALLPLALVVEIRSWPLVVAFFGSACVAALSSVYFARTGRPSVPIVLAVNLAIALLFTRLGGPFVLTPLMVCCAVFAISAIPAVNARGGLVIGWTVLAVLLPIVLEWSGVLPRTWGLASGQLTIVSAMVRTDGWLHELVLVGAGLFFTLVLAWFALAINRRRRLAQQQLYMQAWHLRQLLPRTNERWTPGAR